MNLSEFIARQLKDIQAGWSIGSFGAIGEFHQRMDDHLLVDDPTQLLYVTEKGGIWIDQEMLHQSKCIAYEGLSRNPQRWSSEVVFCLPELEARMNNRDQVTELGLDQGALRDTDRTCLLFDMGLSLANVDFCIRTSDPELIRVLRGAEGKSIFAPDNPAMAAILKLHPHRVVISKLGRVEIYQKIGGPETGGVSPDGPHTHVLPKLIKSGRTHSANTPVPDCFFPCLYLHPANPVMAPDGKDIPFQIDYFTAFQNILAQYGDPEILSLKGQVREAVANLKSPADFPEPTTRQGRAAMRIALRQLLREADHRGDIEFETRVKSWQTMLDPNVTEAQSHSDTYTHS